MYGFGTHGWGMGVGGLLSLLLIVAIVYLLLGNRRADGASPKEILDQRYARGEIDTKEYHERLKALQESEEQA